MQPIRQGDVILTPTNEILGEKLPHVILAEGEVTGHSHRISEGRAELYERDGILYLLVLSRTATLRHEEHHAVAIPRGKWTVRIQREYSPRKRKATVGSKPVDLEADDASLWDGLTTQPKPASVEPEPIPVQPKPPQVNWRFVED